ncbi:MAG: hypothetical protein H6Q05_2024 [Acidobacteria bacterium]|nr:hypothetical protein [Acidobacteriota bacterium]
MKTIECLIIVGAALLLLLIFVYPPWMSIDPQSEGRVHAGLGHHAIWNPPSPETIFRALYPNAPELPNAERLAGFTPRVNKVGLTIYALAIGLAGSLAILLIRRLRRRIQLQH